MKNCLLIFHWMMPLFLVALFSLSSCNKHIHGDKDKPQLEGVENAPSDPTPQTPISPTTYNIFVENSASMKGFFNRSNTLKQIIQEYYDRIDATHSPITLNLINNNIVRQHNNIDRYLNNLLSNCNAKWSEMDKILEIAMDTLGKNDVNLVISDYCFESPYGDFKRAQSHITNIFQKRLNSGKDLSIAIFKYNCDFNGTTYPSKRNCTHDLPAYVWAFGSTGQIKKFLKLPIKVNRECLVLEPFQNIQPKLIVSHARMLDKNDKNTIIVSEWKKDRRSKGYKLKLELDLNTLAIDEITLSDIKNYSITQGYNIDAISHKDDIYLFEISTNHPSPGDVTINLVNNLPQWVFDSNFEDENQVPDSGKTLGIKYLIEGVFDAYNYSNKQIFAVSFKLK